MYDFVVSVHGVNKDLYIHRPLYDSKMREFMLHCQLSLETVTSVSVITHDISGVTVSDCLVYNLLHRFYVASLVYMIQVNSIVDVILSFACVMSKL